MTIRHSRGAYDIKTSSLPEALATLPEHSFVITDSRVKTLYGRLIASEIPLRAVPEGEPSKSLEQVANLLAWLIDVGADRHSTIVALGGGVIGDLAGFVAAIFMRGASYLQIPTTLVAQVDSSVGGKVGIDLPEGKNLAGAFWPPAEVRLCTDALSTLDDRQFSNGMAEVWKYGLVMQAGLFEDLRRNPLGKADERLERVVRRCIELKASVVTEDEFEISGRRAILNFGHTVGHAIEYSAGLGLVQHGEAIGVGMIAETVLGEIIGVTPAGTSEVVREALSQLNMPRKDSWFKEERRLLELMRRDKKAQGGNMAFSLLTQIGECKLVRDVKESDVLKALEAL